MKEKIFNLLVYEIKFFSIIILIASISAYWGKYNFIFDIFSHFRVQYLIALVTFLMAVFVINRYKDNLRWVFAVLILCILINCAEVFPWLGFNYSSTAGSGGVKILLSNVLKYNHKYNLVLDAIEKNSPDIVVLQEVTKSWNLKLKELKSKYPYSKHALRKDSFGLSMYSRIPVENQKTEYWGRFGVPVITFDTVIQEKPAKVLVIHTTPPLSPDHFANRDDMLKEAEKWVKSDNKPSIIVGDLNTTMFSPSYKALKNGAKLVNSRRGFGLYPSWPTNLWAPLRIPIDHVLHTKDLKTISFKTGQPVNSDHLPVIVRVLRPKA